MPRTWDLFCRVIDNHGDLGVAWRLAADLASRGERVRLWVDDARALAWMAPSGQAGVELVAWTEPAPDLAPGAVVVETFGCDLPPRFVERMAARQPAPAWINLEYLSAEAYVERSHGLPSPVTLAGGKTLERRFFYPGFTPHTGGLLCEPGLLARLRDFDRAHWLAANGVAPQAGERLVSLFCYANPALPALVDRLCAAPTLLLAAPGAATEQIAAALGPALRRGALRVRCLPWLAQTEYDHLLRACDLNFVRGEDSFVRAQWAGRPFVWQIYPQQDGSHRAKLLAFLDRMLADGDARVADPLRALMLGWNGFGPLAPGLPPLARWQSHCEQWRDGLAVAPDLTTQLLGLVVEML
ncbi:MAG: elongation factor P maturation arginine rhamnosyltransferase EarP [Ideonella sp.]|nr:elongation factor P maturation arginine rhamnosyltransferase EarP [Ideonella sp.]